MNSEMNLKLTDRQAAVLLRKGCVSRSQLSYPAYFVYLWHITESGRNALLLVEGGVA